MKNRHSETRLNQGLYIYRQKDSRFWYCRVYISNKRYKCFSTKEESKIKAREVAEQEFQILKDNKEIGTDEKRTFNYFADLLIKQDLKLTGKSRSKRFARDTKQIIERKYYGLKSYFKNKDISKITTFDIREYLNFLDSKRDEFLPLAYSTKNKYIVTIRKIMKIAYEMNVIEKIPLSPKIEVDKNSSRDNPRASFSEQQYKKLLQVTKQAIKNESVIRGVKVTDEIYYLIVFQVHTFLRPTQSELFGIKYRDIKIENSPSRLEIQVQGKTGFRTVSSLSYAVDFFQKLKKLNNYESDDFIFFKKYTNRDTATRNWNSIFNHLLEQANLKLTNKGQRRTTYALRHYSLQTRIRKSKGKVNIYFLARNSGTSVEQLERFYLKYMESSDVLVENLQSF